MKKLFCKHIWKTVSVETIRNILGYNFGILEYQLKVNAVTVECIKCKKTKIIEEKFVKELSFDEKDKLIKELFVDNTQR